MAQARMAELADRGVVAVEGEDAARLLQGVLTNDLDRLEREPSIFAALLIPQGKIIVDFIVRKVSGALLLECPTAMAGDLVRRLVMYRLRARAMIRDATKEWRVAAAWGGPLPLSLAPFAAADPRHAALGWRLLIPAAAAAPGAGEIEPATRADYDRHRVALGIPEGGADYAYGDAFAHDAMLDRLDGVSFTKGCYVGQEIVSRMQHRGTARRRIARVVALSGPLPATGAPITAAGVEIGRLGTVAGGEGLGLVRIDRAAEAQAKGQPLLAGEAAVRIELPAG